MLCAIINIEILFGSIIVEEGAEICRKGAADPERGRGTICLAVSPSLKAKGVRNRCRVYEIPKCFSYIMAEPRMQLYINYAAEIYGIYLRDTLAPQTDYGLLAHLRRHEMTEVLHFYIGYSQREGITPPPTAGTVRLPEWTHSRTFVTDALVQAYRRSVWHNLPIRHIFLNAERVRPDDVQELSIFGPFLDREREMRRQQAILDLQERFGKDAVFYARDLLDGATTLQRYHQIGGHKRGKDTDTQVQSRKDFPAIRCPGGTERRAPGKRA